MVSPNSQKNVNKENLSMVPKLTSYEILMESMLAEPN